MTKALRIVYLEDNPSDAELAIWTLKKSGMSIELMVVETRDDYIRAIETHQPDLILSDHSLPGFDAMQAYNILQELRPDIPFILLTGSVSEQFAVDCLLAGIDDYILKSNLIRLPSSIERVFSKSQISKEKAEIESLHKALKGAYQQIEIHNRDTQDSIRYAQRIQDALLPGEDYIDQEFHAGFVLYKPRNIVSGDFYWLAKTTTTDERTLALNICAAIDCTGHGVPGAFMSLLVSELLNQTLKNKDINSPADVLNHLNKRLPESLNKNHKEQITDGLDIALCALDPVRRKVYFSGANMPLWIMKKNGQALELVEYKGTKASIGVQTNASQVFEAREIQVEAGDRLYMFSDGIPDQFGGPRGKKLGRNALKQLIAHSAGMSMKEQKQYLEVFLEEWRKDYEQVDDQLLLAVEIG